MPKHKVGTRAEWSAARKALLEREQELAGEKHGVRHLPGSRHARTASVTGDNA